MTPHVVLLILTWNRRDDVLRCVASLPRLTYPRLTPVVVDNASADDTVAALQAAHPGLAIIRNPSNLGYAGGNNVGIRWALARGADYALLINSDTEVTAGMVDELVRVAESDARIAVVGCRNLLLEDPARLWGAFGTLTYGPFLVRSEGAGQPDGAPWRGTRDVDVAIGNGYLWRRTALEQIGLLDESLFGYHEDVDWCLRARRAGWRVVYAGDAAILHRGGSSSAPGAHRVFPQAYFLGRNGVRIAQRYGAPRQQLRFAAASLAACAGRAARAALRRDAPGIARERAFLRGALDAWRDRPIPFAALGMADVR
ncbi:glycosyltransferase family 2 protein [bacterium]|nr:glycosyltransferase family 2 protein [bacterium]